MLADLAVIIEAMPAGDAGHPGHGPIGLDGDVFHVPRDQAEAGPAGAERAPDDLGRRLRHRRDCGQVAETVAEVQQGAAPPLRLHASGHVQEDHAEAIGRQSERAAFVVPPERAQLAGEADGPTGLDDPDELVHPGVFELGQNLAHRAADHLGGVDAQKRAPRGIDLDVPPVHPAAVGVADHLADQESLAQLVEQAAPVDVLGARFGAGRRFGEAGRRRVGEQAEHLEVAAGEGRRLARLELDDPEDAAAARHRREQGGSLADFPDHLVAQARVPLLVFDQQAVPGLGAATGEGALNGQAQALLLQQGAAGGAVFELVAVEQFDHAALGGRQRLHRPRDDRLQHDVEIAVGRGHGGLRPAQHLANPVAVGFPRARQVAQRHRPPQLELRHHLPRQGAEVFGLGVGEAAGPGLAVDRAQAAEHQALGRDQRRPGVEADERLARHQRVVAGPRIGGQVGDDEELVGVSQRVGAHRAVQVGLAGRKADARLEPLPIAGDQADECHRHRAEAAGEVHDVVEALLGGGVEDGVVTQRGEASGVVDERWRSGRHGGHRLTLVDTSTM